MDPYIGEIKMFPGSFAPEGWFTCEGQTVAISQYEALFSIVGTTYGGDGVATFKLPDLRGAFPTQCTNVAGSHPGGTYAWGQTGGVQNASITSANLPAHTHAIVKGAGTNITGSVNVTTTILASQADAALSSPSNGSFMATPFDSGSGAAEIYNNATAPLVNMGGVSNTVNSSLNFDPTGLALTPAFTGGTVSGVPVTPSFVAMQYIIAWTGIYPSRP